MNRIPVKIIRYIGVVFLLLTIVSCNTIMIPGEKGLRMRNLYTEYYELAKGYTEIKKYDKAIECYEHALKDKTIKKAAYYEIACCYAKTEEYDKASKMFYELLKNDPANIDLRQSYAYCRLMSGRIEVAIDIYEQILWEEPDLKAPRRNYIAALIAKDMIEEAKAQFNIFCQKFPDDDAISDFEDMLDMDAPISVPYAFIPPIEEETSDIEKEESKDAEDKKNKDTWEDIPKEAIPDTTKLKPKNKKTSVKSNKNNSIEDGKTIDTIEDDSNIKDKENAQ